MDGTIRFAEKTLALLDDGSFSATYKYAVLLSLIDLCLEETQKDGAPPSMVTTNQLAGKVVEFYWRQAAPFVVETGRTLLQNTGQQAAILSQISKFRRQTGGNIGATMHRSRLEHPQKFKKLMREVEWKLVEMPLPRLQRVGREQDRFLYEIAWDEGIRRGEWSDSDRFDNRILFLGNAAEQMVRLSGLLRPLIKRQWSDMVARINRELIPDSKLDEFLFGIPRKALQSVRAPLIDLQQGDCFYCQQALLHNGSEVDHFMPWSRYPDNGIDNLVVAHRKCNQDKRDFLVSAEHLDHWVERQKTRSSDLENIAGDIRWERDLCRTGGVIRGVYLRLPDDMKLWVSGKDFVDADGTRLATVLEE